MLACHGLPIELVNYNGPLINSVEFKDFMLTFEIRHVLLSLRHPQGNEKLKQLLRLLKTYFTKWEMRTFF